jgi:uncharacterized protein YecE (DUF72 family)
VPPVRQELDTGAAGCDFRRVPYDPSTFRIGTQGWNYDAWVGPFFPEGTRATDFLTTYARAFDTVEVDSTFYAIPPAKTVRGWASRVPAGFTFALKMPQQITHEQRLRACEDLVALFADRARELGDALGPVLLQLGPDFGLSELPALASFLPLLPRDIRFAAEFRDRRWINEGVLALLAEHQVALALVDARWIPRRTMLKLAEAPTTDFAYVRWMGPDRSIVDYSRVQVDRTKEIDAWVAALPALAERVATVHVYVNNHFSGHSPATARLLQERLGLGATPPAELADQLSLL